MIRNMEKVRESLNRGFFSGSMLCGLALLCLAAKGPPFSPLPREPARMKTAARLAAVAVRIASPSVLRRFFAQEMQTVLVQALTMAFARFSAMGCAADPSASLGMTDCQGLMSCRAKPGT